MHSPRNSPAASVVSLCLAAPSGGRGEEEKAPAGRCLSSLQLLWIYPEFSVDGGSSAMWQYSRIGELAAIVAFFHLGRKLGGLKLWNR